MCGTKESATPKDQLEVWKETVLIPTLEGYLPSNIYNGDETVSLTELIASLVKSLLVLQNVKTG